MTIDLPTMRNFQRLKEGSPDCVDESIGVNRMELSMDFERRSSPSLRAKLTRPNDAYECTVTLFSRAAHAALTAAHRERMRGLTESGSP